MSFISACCFAQVFYSHDMYQQVVKKWTGRIVSNPLFSWEAGSCPNWLRDFSVTKPRCYDVFINSFCSPTFMLWNPLFVELSLWLQRFLNLRYRNLFQRSLRVLCYKDAGVSKSFASKCWLLVNKYIAQKFMIN